MKRHKTSAKLALRIARSQLRVYRGIARAPGIPGVQAKPGPPQFLQCWAVGRGYSGVTQALDSQGQVWERVSLMDEKEIEGKKVKYLRDSYWIRISMQRRALDTEEEA